MSSFWMLAVNPVGKFLLGQWIYVQKPIVPSVGILFIHLSPGQGFIDGPFLAFPSYIGDFAVPKIISRCHGQSFRVIRFDEIAVFHQLHHLPGLPLAQFLVQAVNIRKRGAYESIGGNPESVV